MLYIFNIQEIKTQYITIEALNESEARSLAAKYSLTPEEPHDNITKRIYVGEVPMDVIKSIDN